MGKGKPGKSAKKLAKLHRASGKSPIQKPKKQQRGPRPAGEGSSGGERKAPAVSRCPYLVQHRTLLLGEGDFSFAAALCLLWGDAANLVATAFDTETVAASKYSALEANVETIRNLGGTVLFGVDATACHLHGLLSRAHFERIIFNFPHAGSGIKDQQRNIATNQALLRGSFTSASALLCGGGQLHVTLKRGEPYDSWSAVPLAKLCGLRVAHCTPFSSATYPGYEHRRTIGDTHAGDASQHAPNAEIGGAKTYAFVGAHDAPAQPGPSQRGERKGQKNHKAVFKKTSHGMRKI